MGKHSDAPVEADGTPLPPLRQRLLILGGGILATVVAWGFLVGRAIHFGSDGKHGESGAWFFMVMATIGATACLFLGLILGNRILKVLRNEPLRRRASMGGKRAAR